MTKMNDLHPHYITNESGEKQSVVLSISDFEALMEDIKDLAAVAERKNEATISHEKLLAGLKDNGLI